MNLNELNAGFWSTLRDSSVLELVADAGEVGLDALTEGPLKEVPFFGSLVKLWRAGAQVRDLLFVAKLARFLRVIRAGNHKIAQDFATRVADDDDLRHRVGTNVLLALDRLDDLEKPELLARAFLHLASGETGYDQFSEFILAIDRCLLPDLHHLGVGTRRMALAPSAATRLSSCGLVEIENIPTIDGVGAGNYYRMTEMGTRFVQLILEYPI